ncbi:hypothetical protein IJT10_07735, partial [bacterium]|nr:hypothetical protein [bacterium]
NLGLKLLAFFMALITSILVKTVAQPIRDLPAQRVYTKSIDLLVPDKNNLVGSLSTKEVTVTVRGKKNVLDRIDPKLISAVVDLTNRDHQGSFYTPVDVMAPGGAEITHIEPSHVWASVYERSFTNVPVKAKILGHAEDNFSVGALMASPDKVRISGSSENVEKVAYVEAPVSVSGCNSTFSTRVQTLNPIDANGNAIKDVEVYASSGINVTVPVYFSLKARINLDHIEIRSDKKYKISVDPPEVTIKAESSGEGVLQEIFTEDYSFEFKGREITKKVRLELPEQMKRANLSQNIVTITVKPEDEK